MVTVSYCVKSGSKSALNEPALFGELLCFALVWRVLSVVSFWVARTVARALNMNERGGCGAGDFREPGRTVATRGARGQTG